jgi:hypothetical protein
MKQPTLKAILSSLLLLLFLFLALSGALLYFGKTGMILGLARYAWRNTHVLAALLICIAMPAHLFLNRRLYFKELQALLGCKPHHTKAGAQDENS